jgi:hypothetical protein
MPIFSTMMDVHCAKGRGKYLLTEEAVPNHIQQKEAQAGLR